MTALTPDKLRHLVREDRVHRDVYLDPAIFALEMERIHGRAWVYIGHESQVPHPGDYLTTAIGSQPVIMSRHGDGKVYVLHNRCGHRGAKVLNEEHGRAQQFRCLYHGWAYAPDGELLAVPLPDLYPEGYDLSDRRLGLAPVARMGIYRGFVFASLAANGPDLRTHLGRATDLIDEMVNRSPEGEVEVFGGRLRYEIRGNWKLQAENLADQYHVPFGHESTASRDGFQFQRRTGESGARARVFGDDGSPYLQESGTWAWSNGFNANGAMHFDGKQSGPVWETYRASMIRAYGANRAEAYMRTKHHNALLYPNLDLHMLGLLIRVIRPIAVDRTEVTIFPVRLKGAPPEMARDVIKLANITHSATSLIQTDDVESFERCQAGLHSQGSEWVDFVRGQGLDADDREWGGRYGPITSEIGMRNQHRAWLDYMCAA
jgi:phenylpropionate dioxygenase-like ring-hydroxylating dioxygenase large terminal subunit